MRREITDWSYLVTYLFLKRTVFHKIIQQRGWGVMRFYSAPVNCKLISKYIDDRILKIVYRCRPT